MNYLKHYCKLVRKAENRKKPDGYIEKHHIFPVSIFGKNDRIVILTAREHYIAHVLLEKICLKRYGENHSRTKKMTYAHIHMKARSKLHSGERYINSIFYEKSRERLSNSKKGKNNHMYGLTGDKNPFYGKKHTPETIEKIKKKLPDLSGPNNPRWGVKISQEQKDKYSKTRCKTKYLLTNSSGQSFVYKNIPKFCKENDLHYSLMNRVLRKKQSHHKGWKIEPYKMEDIKFVPKSWGFEKWICNSPEYCGKLLYFVKGKKCSFHYHKLKDETFYLQSGKILLTYGDTDDINEASQIILEKGDKFHIYRELRHQMLALEDTELFEFSTQHFDNDSYRIIHGD
jgi:mannose-6-phosphate isomerase-like protein (cupin superfamily)